MKGRLLFEYRPPRAHPILYAGLMVFAFVWVTGSLENLARDGRPALYGIYGLPFVATLAIIALTFPSDTRIFNHGIEPSRPLVLGRRFVPWTDLRAVYPSYYDVTGAFVSPFASSDGKVTQMGLALEHHNGRVETVRFTPSRFTMWQPASAGYAGAMEAVKHAFGDRPLVTAAETMEAETAKALLANAHKPFLPFWAIVFLFASAAPVLWVLLRLGADVLPSLAIALLAPLGVSLRSLAQSRKRHAILNRISKAAAFRRQA